MGLCAALSHAFLRALRALTFTFLLHSRSGTKMFGGRKHLCLTIGIFARKKKEALTYWGCHNKERLRLVYKYAQYDRELPEPYIYIIESDNQAFSSGNTGPQRRVAGMHRPRPQNWCEFFSICFTKCFRYKSESVSETKIEFFWNVIVFIEKTFAKSKCFRNESKIVCVFETKRFWFSHKWKRFRNENNFFLNENGFI